MSIVAEAAGTGTASSSSTKASISEAMSAVAPRAQLVGEGRGVGGHPVRGGDEALDIGESIDKDLLRPVLCHRLQQPPGPAISRELQGWVP